MGIPVEGPAYIFGDNQSVLANTSKPHSTLKKKSSSVAFHFVREGVAKVEWRTINTNQNPSDMLTKSLAGGEKRNLFTSYCAALSIMNLQLRCGLRLTAEPLHCFNLNI